MVILVAQHSMTTVTTAYPDNYVFLHNIRSLARTTGSTTMRNNKLSTWNIALQQKKKVAAPFKNVTPYMEPKCLELCSQDHAIRPYPKSAESGP
jgi:hypothetical protein